MRLAHAVLGVAAVLASAGQATAAMQFRTFKSIKYGYSLAVPSEWEQRLEKNDTITFTGSSGVLVVRLQLPAAWQATSGDATAPAFAGEDVTLQILVDGNARYLSGDAEILAKSYVARAHYKLSSLATGKLDGQPAYFAYCEPPDKPEWGACFIVFVRSQRLHVLKIAYQQARGKDVVQELPDSF